MHRCSSPTRGLTSALMRRWEAGEIAMESKGSDFYTVILDAEIRRRRPPRCDDGRWPESSARDARRIAELEQKVRELQRDNETLNAYLTKELELGLTPDSPRPRATFLALGPIEAVVDGRPADLGAPKQRALLALLVSQVGQPVATDVIVEELWSGCPPPSAITSLQTYVANLRRALEPDRAPRRPTTVLRTCGRSYLLDGRAVEVDVHRFEEHVAAGFRALDRGHPQQALSEFETGLALWRGQAYADVANATCVLPRVVRLEELRLSVVEGRCAALLGVGAHEVAVAELEAFTQSHPLREYGYELLSLALYRAGRQADALAALRANQRRLAEELGIDPRPALRRLEREILNQAPALDWHQPLPPSRAGQETSPHGLPEPTATGESYTRSLAASDSSMRSPISGRHW